MQEFYFHIHGKPYSQEVWKKDAYYDYFNSIYSNAYLNASTDESFMIIEILDKMVHYTYMRSKNIRDNAEREGSFFAITVSFKSQYCSVFALYNLLDQIYNKIAKNSFFIQSEFAGCLKYKVLQLEDANVAEQMHMAFEKNTMYLNLRNLSTPTDTIRSTETKVVSLMDVDSPEFVDTIMTNRVVVSPKLESAIIRCGKIESDLNTIRAQKKALSSSNEQLKSEIAILSKENESLSDQLHSSASSTEKKYKTKLEQLQNDLTNIAEERDSLKQKIQEAISSIELIDQPFQKLTRLLAGRFPESRSQKRNDYLEEEHEANTRSQKPIWRDWLNSILLGLILVCCVVILALALKSNTSKPESSKDINATIMTKIADNDQKIKEETSYPEETETEGTKVEYSDWNDCTINVIGSSNGIVKKKMKYTVKVCLKDWNKANVPTGIWLIDLGDNNPINSDGADSFVVPDKLETGTNLLIKYMYNNVPVVTRTVKVE